MWDFLKAFYVVYVHSSYDKAAVNCPFLYKMQYCQNPKFSLDFHWISSVMETFITLVGEVR